MLSQERINGRFRVLIQAGIEKRIAKVSQRPAPIAQKLAGNRFSAEDVGLIGIHRGHVNVHMGIGVVAEFGTGVELHVEQGWKRLSRQVLADPALIDEPSHGH